jgi:hypothetical protein
MGGYGWIDWLVVLGLRAGVLAVRWVLRHPFGTAAAVMVLVAVAQ